MKKLFSTVLCIAMLLSMATTASAAYHFSPSREPVEPVIQTDENGMQYFGITHDNDDFRLPLGWLILSNLEHESYPDRSTLSDEAIDILEKADAKIERVYREFHEINSVFGIFGTDRLSPDKNYAITRLFDLTPVDEGIAEVEKAFRTHGTLEVPLRLEMPSDREYYFATLCEDEWVILEDEQIRKDELGVVSIFFYELCPIALIEEIDPTGEVVESPQTSPAFPMFEMFAAVFALAAVGCFVMAGKKRDEA